MIGRSWFALVALLSTNCVAEELQLEYKSFYSHVKKLNGDDTNALQFSFGLVNMDTNKLCSIREARISTDKKQIPLTINAESRFTVPMERALRLADAIVILDLGEPSDRCDMSVQLETKPEFLKQQYSKEELFNIYKQYQIFFEDMGGFLSFMMPSVTGINMHFEDGQYVKVSGTNAAISGGVLPLTRANIEDIYRLDLSQQPLRITAVTAKN